jgi:8-oxo-dGTP pyrophosphatase MutT (NUDIX family)
VRRWTRAASVSLYRHRLFELRREELADAEGGDERREALVLEAPRWVNVVPVLPDGRVLLVRQWRFGIGAPTLEIPGGMVERDEEPRAAAARELEEETGYRAARLELLGEVEPNPAFLTNRCATYLATGLVRIGEPAGDGEEEIELESARAGELAGLVAAGEIRHALVIAALYLWEHGMRA